MQGPNPETPYPILGYDKLVFLKHFIQAPNIHVGDYTYFDDQIHGPETFEKRNVLYNHQHSKVKLVIGKFCALAAETRFLMTGDHKLDGISTFPFPIFQNGWENAYNVQELPLKGDIIVGHDVWFGYNAFVKGGVTIGSGAIIATQAVVVKDVPPYTIVAGNPARVVKQRFDDKAIEKLLHIAWWNWDIGKIQRHLKWITHHQVERLEEASAQE